MTLNWKWNDYRSDCWECEPVLNVWNLAAKSKKCMNENEMTSRLAAEVCEFKKRTNRSHPISRSDWWEYVLLYIRACVPALICKRTIDLTVEKMYETFIDLPVENMYVSECIKGL